MVVRPQCALDDEADTLPAASARRSARVIVCGARREESENMDRLAMWIMPLLFFAIWLGVVIYVLTLATRLTRAAERIAASLERRQPGPM